MDPTSKSLGARRFMALLGLWLALALLAATPDLAVAQTKAYGSAQAAQVPGTKAYEAAKLAGQPAQDEPLPDSAPSIVGEVRLACPDFRPTVVGWRIDLARPDSPRTVAVLCVATNDEGKWTPGTLGFGEQWTGEQNKTWLQHDYRCPTNTVVVGTVYWVLSAVLTDVVPVCRSKNGGSLVRVTPIGLGYPQERVDPLCMEPGDSQTISVGWVDGRLSNLVPDCADAPPVLSTLTVDDGERGYGADEVPGDRPSGREDAAKPKSSWDRNLDTRPPCIKEFRDPGSPAPTPTGECIPLTEDVGPATDRVVTSSQPTGSDEPPQRGSVVVQQTTPTATPPPLEDPAVPDCPRSGGAILVPANMGWCNSRVKLSGNGLRLTITAQGRWSNEGPPARGPEGFVGYVHPGTIVADAELASLVARIGVEPGFRVGARFDSRNGREGWLLLSINDTPDTFGDNQGYVEVRVQERPE